jgi:hypothetical protein
MSQKGKAQVNGKIYHEPHLSPGLSPDVWGPWMWALMNDVAVVGDYYWNDWNATERKYVTGFYDALKDILPCKWCRESYKKFIKRGPPRYPFTQWIYRLHNKVNRKLNKVIPFNYKKFKRRTVAYTSFGGANQLWDLIFMLALNYDPADKLGYYKRLFKYLRYLSPYLITSQEYDEIRMIPFRRGVPRSALRTKNGFLEWLAHHRKRKEKVSYWIRKYANALGFKNDKDLWKMCGPLLYETVKREQQEFH